MISLFDVKKYHEYDFVQDTVPTGGTGTWLRSLTDGAELRGYSYNVVAGVPTRIEEQEDARIEASIHSTVQNVLDWLNNYFYIERQTQDTSSWSYRFKKDYSPIGKQWKEIDWYVSDSALFSFNESGTIDNVKEDTFQVGDLVRVNYSVRNNLVGWITDISGTQITLDNPNMRTIEENATIFYCDMPKYVEQIIAQMINYDVFEREITDLNSETVGNYSYSKDKDFISVGGLDYPSKYVSSLIQYQKTRFIS